MTPLLHQYMRKWRIYKTALSIFLALNVFSISGAFFVGLRYYKTEKESAKVEAHILDQLQSIGVAQLALKTFHQEMKSWQKTKTPYKSAKLLEEDLKLRLNNWQSFAFTLNKVQGIIEDSSTNREITPLLTDTAENEEALSRFESRLSELAAKNYSDLKVSIESKAKEGSVFIWIGIATLLFGIVLPSIISIFMAKVLNHLRIELQKTAVEIVRSFTDTKEKFGETAFKNAEFWLQIILLVGQHGSLLSGHPMVRLSGELAYLVRQELKKDAT